ncbi:hypothetical protein B0H34DRAFT_803065 [Crassisporium funariophilum]|nr:hypothetical protein B0H34DRAFT_803065 [Crassisporium funariophilum]
MLLDVVKLAKLHTGANLAAAFVEVLHNFGIAKKTNTALTKAAKELAKLGENLDVKEEELHKSAAEDTEDDAKDNDVEGWEDERELMTEEEKDGWDEDVMAVQFMLVKAVLLMQNDVNTFAQAIASRFVDNPILTGLPSPMNICPRPSSSLPSAYTPIPSSAIDPWLEDVFTLIVNIRPHAAYSSACIPRTISLSVPSILLKHPLFLLQRLSAMLPSTSARNCFSAWPSALRILV